MLTNSNFGDRNGGPNSLDSWVERQNGFQSNKKIEFFEKNYTNSSFSSENS